MPAILFIYWVAVETIIQSGGVNKLNLKILSVYEMVPKCNETKVISLHCIGKLDSITIYQTLFLSMAADLRWLT